MTEPKKLDPIISEFATQEEADAYDVWFRKQVQEALDDPAPGIPHEDVMRSVRETIEQAAKRGLAEGKQAEYEASQRLDPFLSEFATQEEADAYDAWFRQQVQESLDDPAPSIPHEDVMREMRQIISQAAERNRKERG